MAWNFEGDEVLFAAIAGLPKVAELIAAIPAEDLSRALDATEESYVQTAIELGYEETDAQQWASVIMLRLRIAMPIRLQLNESS